ncbi:MAG: IS3 family transposase [Spiribacter salinus]|uniref:IS3 family transposase n=1 Tax=Spiribacter salinus TaxID=1335746 RepID=A0A540V8T8_9GAMM|nr:MAG: IS3 family transposase [Spiribacter salinus]
MRRVERRPPVELVKHVSHDIYGRPQIHVDLAAKGWPLGGKRVGRLMRAQGLRGVSRRKGTVTTVAAAERRPQPDLVERDFTATAPDQLYVADITYVPTWADFFVPGHRTGRVQSPRTRLVHGNASAGRTGPRGPGYGAVAATPLRRYPSQRPGQPVHVDRLRPALPTSRRPPFHGLGRRLLR